MTEERDRRDDWRYLLLLYQDDTPVWFETQGRLPGIPEGTARIKVGARHYFLEGHSLFYDIETQRMICFLEIRDTIHFGQTELGPEGEFKPGQSPDAYEFIKDARFKQLAKPF
jgi:hypothetical protein